MMSQKIIVTTLPWKDYKTGKNMLSAFMSIQLDAGKDTKLSAFPDILQWMDKLQNAKFFVQWGNAAPQDLTVKKDKWDAALYAKLFYGGINVKSFNPQGNNNIILNSYPVKHVQDYILGLYKEVGNIKTDVLPTADFFATNYKKLDPLAETQLKATKPITNRRGEATVNDFIARGHTGRTMARQVTMQSRYMKYSPQANVATDFGQFYNFHSRNAASVRKSPSLIPKPEFEYHDILSIITSYPAVMRKLGLVLDFELGELPPALSANVRVLVSNLSFANDVQISCPATVYQRTPNGFHAAPKDDKAGYIQYGMLKLNTDNFSVTQIDADGAAMKMAAHAETLNFGIAKVLVDQSNYIPFIPFIITDENNKTDNTPKPEEKAADKWEGLPSLRSAGIGIVKNGLAETLIALFDRNQAVYTSFPGSYIDNGVLYNKTDAATAAKSLSAPELATRTSTIRKAFQNVKVIPVATEFLYAEDLVQGYRMDIAYEEAPDKWYSLHQRKPAYSYVPTSGGEEAIVLSKEEETDEGMIHLALSQDDVDDVDKEHKVSEVLARWEGWSLSVPRPGKSLNNTGAEVSSDADEAKKYRIDKDAAFRLQVLTAPAPRTLPALRFGKAYCVKIRTVDIAGNSLPFDKTPENASLAVQNGIKYLRYEPLPAPVLMQGDEVVSGDKSGMRDRDGESIEHMVIRSNGNLDAKRPEIDLGRNQRFRTENNDNLTPEQYEAANPTNVYQVVNNSRGASRGNNRDGHARYNIAGMDKETRLTATLTYLAQAVRHVAPPRTSQQMAEVHGVFDGAFKDAATARQLYDFIVSKDKETKDTGKRKADVIPAGATAAPIEYLADPLAAGVILTMVTDTTFETSWKKGQSRKFSFYFNDEVTDSNANTPYSADAWRSPKSFRIVLTEGSKAPEWSAGERLLTIYLPKSAEIQIKYASFWRPADIDKYSAMHQVVNAGIATGRGGQHARSGLHWMFSPWRHIRLVHAVQQPLKKPAATQTVVNKDYEDTFVTINTQIAVHGSSTDKIDVEAVWTEWIDDMAKTAPQQITGKTHVDTIQVEYTSTSLSCTMPANGSHRLVSGPRRQQWLHAFNDTKHRMVNYTMVGTTRYREYFSGIIETAVRENKKEVSLTRSGDVMQLNILSSAKPSVPEVAYVVPSFNWVKNKAGGTETHLRTGNIRVYLKRPWYSSGDDEQLGVLLTRPGLSNEGAERYCTVWGKDPAFVGLDLNNSNFPVVDHFPDAAAYQKIGVINYPLAAQHDTVLLPEHIKPGIGVITVAVAGHKVMFDEEKQLHYADVPIFIANAYFPFVKLAVARYQKNSLRIDNTDCCISALVHTDWMQVVPSRTTTVTGHSGGLYEVSLKGPSASFGNNPNIKVKITVTVENASLPKTEEAFISMNDRTIATTESVKETELDSSQIKNGMIDFTMRIPAKSGNRIVIREYEMHEADPIRVWETEKNAFAVSPKFSPDFDDRLVFMDVFELA